MNVLTLQILIDNVAERWFNQYHRHGVWVHGLDKQLIYEKLIALEKPNLADIQTIIGNSSWTSLRCDSCKNSYDKVVVLDVTDGEYTTYLCLDCLKCGTELLEKTNA